MTRAVSDGLAKITVATPKRRIDIALPENVPVVELMTALLRNAGESAADDAQRIGGWVLHRSDGQLIDQFRTLSDQQVRDGEILHMVGRETEWPETDYDDVVDAIATGTRKSTSPWSGNRTHTTGLVLAGLAFSAALYWLIGSGPAWETPGLIAVGVSLALMFAAFGFSRARPGDTSASVTAGAFAVIYASVGGLLSLGGDQPLAQFDPWQFVLGFGATFVMSVIGFAVVAQQTQVFAAGAWIGLIGLIVSSLALGSRVDALDAATIAIAIVVAFTSSFPLLSIRLGKLPVPTLPTTTDELLRDEPQLPLTRVHATVRRSDEILTGLLIGTSVIVAVGSWLLAGSANTSALIFVGVVSLTNLLRARLFPTARHRVALLTCGFLGVLFVSFGIFAGLSRSQAATIAVPVLVVFGLIAIALGRYFKAHAASPYLARMADIFDVLLTLTVVPLMALVIGLFSVVRGLWG